MADRIDLKNVAQHAQEMMQDPAPIEAQTPPAPAYTGPGVVNIGQHPTRVANPRPDPTPVPLEGDVNLSALPNQGPKPNTTGITDADLRASVPDLSDEEFARIAPGFKQRLDEHQKNLVMQGFTVQEAIQATKARMNKEGTEINNEWVEKHPVSANVVIDKSQMDQVEFTPEEKEKMTAAKTIRLVVVESKELESIPVRKIDNRHKATYIDELSSGLSKYSVPLPATGDYLTFRGAQIMQMTSILSHDDDTMSETLMRKAQLIYDKFIDGTCIKRMDEDNHPISFDDFCNTIAYSDVDMCMYAILCASNMEEISTDLTCRSCNNTWSQKYNIKKTMSTEGFSEAFKARADRVIAARGNEFKMKAERQFMEQAVRYKSPFTQNIYDIEIPTISKANRIFKGVDPNDQLKMYIAALALYTHTLYVWNEKTNDYVKIESTEDEIEMMLDTLLVIPDEDVRMLMNEINEKYIYTPTFQLECVCPTCGNKSTLPLSVDQMVFQKAQDFYAVTQ